MTGDGMLLLAARPIALLAAWLTCCRMRNHTN